MQQILLGMLMRMRLFSFVVLNERMILVFSFFLFRVSLWSNQLSTEMLLTHLGKKEKRMDTLINGPFMSNHLTMKICLFM